MDKKIKLLNFIDLTLEEKKMVLEWRNSDVIKKWMYTKEKILLESHLKFIDGLKTESTKLYFLVKSDDKYIGVIDFTKINKENLHMGIYTNPNLKGFGKTLLELIIDYSFNILNVNEIIAEVFEENPRAYQLYLSYGFIKIDEITFGNRKVLVMKLPKKGVQSV